MSIQDVGFHGEIMKIIPKLSSDTLICSLKGNWEQSKVRLPDILICSFYLLLFFLYLEASE